MCTCLVILLYVLLLLHQVIVVGVNIVIYCQNYPFYFVLFLYLFSRAPDSEFLFIEMGTLKF